MSRSTAETLLRLERDAWVLDGPDGVRRCALDGGAPAAALDALQPPAPGRGRRLRVRLADAWLRYLVVNWPAGLRTASERAAFLAHRFAEVHGVAAPEWVVQADRDAHDLPALGCAAPAAVIAAAQGFAARHGYLLSGIEADFIATYNRLRGRFHEADGELAALAVVHDGRLTVGLWRSGAWRGVRSQSVRDDGAGALRLMLEAWGRESGFAQAPAVGAGGAPAGSPTGVTRSGVLHAVGYAGTVAEGWRRGEVEAGMNTLEPYAR
ncbi:MAG TPA: hypothetical protein DCL01_02525 [Thauera sp.]|nr:hypothetical protein [Thauera sp.]HHW62400.1 hypothetical protein [Rhodocyclaceae bacterium]